MNKYKPYLLCLCSALGLMAICFYNRYPFYDGDTHSYLFQAFHSDMPVDRSPMYGKFVRVTSMWTSLWFTVFSQCLILAYLLLRYLFLLNPDAKGLRSGIVNMLTIVSFTCVSWVCAYLSPDIFGGILLMAVLLYLFDYKASKLHSIIYFIIIALAVSIHNSHFLIVSGFTVLILFYAFKKRRQFWIKRSISLISICALFYLTVCAIHSRYNRGFTFSPASQLFMIAKFASNGILDTYLDDNCGKKNLRLCSCKGQITAYPWDFMWPPPSSPLSKLGVWDSSSQEFKGIVYDIFTTPKYLKMYLTKSAVSAFQQLGEIQVEKPVMHAIDDKQNDYFKIYFGDEFKEFTVSRQNDGSLNPSGFNTIYYLFFVLSSIGILLLYMRSKDSEIALLYACILLFFIINAYVTANFSTVCFRFQYRIFWVLPATNAILLLKYANRWLVRQEGENPIS